MKYMTWNKGSSHKRKSAKDVLLGPAGGLEGKVLGATRLTDSRTWWLKHHAGHKCVCALNPENGEGTDV